MIDASSAVHSAIYRGRVDHRRRSPRPHAFSYRLFMMYLDLDELEQLFAGRWLWSVGRPNVASWRREDYHGDARRPLREAVLQTVREHLGRAPDGPVRMLTHLRMLGLGFNPVTFYYCFEADGSLGAVAAEITNTPWKERHTYVLDASRATPDAGAVTGSFAKAFHVSPFMAMAQRYHWRFTVPGEHLSVHMENRVDGELLFDASLGLAREPVTAGGLARCLLRHPFMTGKVVAGIHWQALRLWLKRTPFHAHPDNLTDHHLEGAP